MNIRFNEDGKINKNDVENLLDKLSAKYLVQAFPEPSKALIDKVKRDTNARIYDKFNTEFPKGMYEKHDKKTLIFQIEQFRRRLRNGYLIR